MALFITYASYSQSGVQGLISNPEDRKAAIQHLCDKVGARVVEIYMTTGRNDVVLVTEGADGADAVALAMAVSASGSLSNAETVRAWTSAEFSEIAKKAGSLTGAYTPPG